MARQVVADIVIHAPPAEVRRMAQAPEQHQRWDLRFSEISYLPRPDPGQPQRFRYATRMGLWSVEGWGETVADRDELGSGLRFGSDAPHSIIREGAGSWRYEAAPESVRFRTVYDYKVRGGILGRLVDAVAFRPAIAWATRWSFDRLRLWLERGLSPEAALRTWLVKRTALTLLGLVWILAGLLPKVTQVRPTEVDLVARSHLVVGSPAFTLAALGWAEAGLGLWLLWGRAPRLAALAATLAMAVLAGLVMALDPAWASDPYSGLVKNLGLLACAATVWLLEEWSPKARRAKG